MRIIRVSLFRLLVIVLLLSGCRSQEEAAKHVTLTLIQSPEAKLAEWHAVTLNQITHTQRFESPLGSIELTRIPTRFTSTSQPNVSNAFSELKHKVEQQISDAHNNLINPADDDLLLLADRDFLHTTYRTRDQNNQRQRIELFLAPTNHQLITIDVRISDDADMQSYSELQTFLTQQVNQFSKTKTDQN
jgi:hypothetical protein